METTETALQVAPKESVFSQSTFEHAQRVATMLSKSELIPKEYQGKVQNIMIALELANRNGASPIMVMQNLYIVHGKPGWSSQFIIASINSCGRFESLRYDVGEGKCTAWTTDKGVKLPENIRTLAEAKGAGVAILEGIEVNMSMAKSEGWLDKAGSKWKTIPELMLRYRAATFFGRLYCPEILMGMQTFEEVIDITPAHQEEISVELLKELLSTAMPELTASELKDANRIIENNETASFHKLLKLLNSKQNGNA